MVRPFYRLTDDGTLAIFGGRILLQCASVVRKTISAHRAW